MIETSELYVMMKVETAPLTDSFKPQRNSTQEPKHCWSFQYIYKKTNIKDPFLLSSKNNLKTILNLTFVLFKLSFCHR